MESPAQKKLSCQKLAGTRGACLAGRKGAWFHPPAPLIQAKLSPRFSEGAWPFGVCGLLANGCSEGRVPRRGGSEVAGAFPPAWLRQIPGSPAAFRLLRLWLWVPPGQPSAHCFRIPVVPAPLPAGPGSKTPQSPLITEAPAPLAILRQDAVGLPTDRLRSRVQHAGAGRGHRLRLSWAGVVTGVNRGLFVLRRRGWR